MKNDGTWHPPELNERVSEVWHHFNRLSKKREYLQNGMNGIVGECFISETEITAYFGRNEVSFDFDWFQTVFYEMDNEHIRLSRKSYSQKAAAREKQQSSKKGRK